MILGSIGGAGHTPYQAFVGEKRRRVVQPSMRPTVNAPSRAEEQRVEIEARQLAGGVGVRPCRRMTSATFAMSGGPPGVDASTS